MLLRRPGSGGGSPPLKANERFHVYAVPKVDRRRDRECVNGCQRPEGRTVSGHQVAKGIKMS